MNRGMFGIKIERVDAGRWWPAAGEWQLWTITAKRPSSAGCYLLRKIWPDRKIWTDSTP